MILDTRAVGSIEAALHSCGCDIRQSRPGCWEAAIERSSTSVSVALDSPWLVIEARLPWRKLTPERLAWLLAANARLPEHVKYCLNPLGNYASVVADLPMLEQTDLDCQAAAAVLQVRDALNDCGSVGPAAEDHIDPIAHQADVVDPADEGLQQRLTEAAIRYHRRANGQLAVAVEGCGPLHWIHLQRRGAGGVYLAAELPVGGQLKPPCRTAIHWLLLVACGATRMVRPAAAGNGYRWEKLFSDGEPTAEQLAWAIEATSLACRCTAREVAGLADPSLAKCYLRARGQCW